MQFDNRWQLLASRLFTPGRTSLLYKYHGLEFLTDHAAGDANGAREVLTSDMYRKYLPQMDLEGPLNVLDIGANNGGFPLLLAAEGYEIGRTVCVELNPKTFERLVFNLERNFGGRAEAINAAVCGEEREIEFTSGTGSTSDNIYGRNANSRHGAISVAGQTFDQTAEASFGSERIDICKMDVEGAEFEIFVSENFTRLTDCRYLLIEIHHSTATPRDTAINAITSAGFDEIDGEDKNDEMHYVHLFVNKRF
jgi:FkbM family methyltransferase